MNTPTVALAVIGTEILTGRVADRNAPYLARRLYELGADLGRIEILPDRVETIAKVVRDLSAGFERVLTTGGLGSTPDDQTMAGLARAFDQALIRHNFLDNLLSHRFEGQELTAARARLAEVPDQATVLLRRPEDRPQVVVRNVYPLPGLPDEAKSAFEALAELFQGPPWFQRGVRLVGDETEVTATLVRATRLHPQVRIGSHASGETDGTVLLTVEARQESDLDRAVAFLLEALPVETQALLEAD